MHSSSTSRWAVTFFVTREAIVKYFSYGWSDHHNKCSIWRWLKCYRINSQFFVLLWFFCCCFYSYWWHSMWWSWLPSSGWSVQYINLVVIFLFLFSLTYLDSGSSVQSCISIGASFMLVIMSFVLVKLSVLCMHETELVVDLMLGCSIDMVRVRLILGPRSSATKYSSRSDNVFRTKIWQPYHDSRT